MNSAVRWRLESRVCLSRTLRRSSIHFRKPPQHANYQLVTVTRPSCLRVALKPHCGRGGFVWQYMFNGRFFACVLTARVYDAELCVLVTVCGKTVCFFYKLRMFLFDQYDHQSITAYIITAQFGHVTLKPQPGPPFWVFHHFAHWSFFQALVCGEHVWFLSKVCTSGSLFAALRRGDIVYLSDCPRVWVCVYFWPLRSLRPLKPQSSVLWFWSGVWTTRRHFALWLCVQGRTSLKRVRAVCDWQESQQRGKKKSHFSTNHIRSQTKHLRKVNISWMKKTGIICSVTGQKWQLRHWNWMQSEKACELFTGLMHRVEICSCLADVEILSALKLAFSHR